MTGIKTVMANHLMGKFYQCAKCKEIKSSTDWDILHYHERSGANFSARIAALSDSSSRIANSAVLRYYKIVENTSVIILEPM